MRPGGMVIAIVLACLVAVVTAQPTPTPDLDRARTEYAAAEKAMAEARFDDATANYANAYRASKDPALLYKIGVARQKSGDCHNAVRLLTVYLQLGKPADDFIAVTRDRIRQCGGDPDRTPDPVPADPVAGWGIATAGSGSADAGSGSGSAAAGSGSAAGSAAAGSAEPSTGSGSAAPPPKVLVPRHRAAWILVGSAIAAATVAAVLAYSANAAERDIDDLYVGLGGVPPTFNDVTRKRFDDLVKEGERYRNFSIASFGVAAILGGIAAYRFVTDEKPPRVQVTPTATPTGAGVSATVRF